MVGPVRGLLLAMLLLSGCVGELLAPAEVTHRTVACAFLDPQRDLQLVHHVGAPVPPETVQAASAAWVAAVANATQRDLERFSWTLTGSPSATGPDQLEAWGRSQRILGRDRLDLHVVWTEALPQPGRAVEVLAPGVAGVNASAWSLAPQVGVPADTAARALLFHGLGHLGGIVNRGIPLHDPQGHTREQPMHHEPGGVMSDDWHHLATFPRETTAREYSAALQEDWRHAARAVCG